MEAYNKERERGDRRQFSLRKPQLLQAEHHGVHCVQVLLVPLLGIPVDTVPGHRGPDHSLRKRSGGALNEESFPLHGVHEDVINYNQEGKHLSLIRGLEHFVLSVLTLRRSTSFCPFTPGNVPSFTRSQTWLRDFHFHFSRYSPSSNIAQWPTVCTRQAANHEREWGLMIYQWMSNKGAETHEKDKASEKAIEKHWHRRSSKMVWVESTSEKCYECRRWSDHWGVQRSKYLREEVLSYILNVYGPLLLMLLPRGSSTYITWELVGGEESWAPPKLYWIRICTLIRSLGCTDAHWSVISTSMDMSDGGSVGEQLNEKLHNVFGIFLRKQGEERTVKGKKVPST